MGYIEGNLNGLDYSYNNGASHYPFWKPSSYFPRGEAPPPYEEAVAISQSELLNAQNSSHETAPAVQQRGSVVNMNPVELGNEVHRSNQCHQSMTLQEQHILQIHNQRPELQQNHHVVATAQAMQNQSAGVPSFNMSHQSPGNQIAQNTTNLINININSGGNITTIATGESHQPPYSTHGVKDRNQHEILKQSAQSNHPYLYQQQNLQLEQENNAGQAKVITTADCNYDNCNLNLSATFKSNNQRRTQRTLGSQMQISQDILQHCLSAADIEVTATPRRYQSLSTKNSGTDIEVIASPSQFSNSPTSSSVITQLAVAVSTPNIEVLPLLCGEISTFSKGNDKSSIIEPDSLITSNQHHNVPHGLPETYKSNNVMENIVICSSANKITSSRRYQRTIPRYFAVSDPLNTKETNFLKTSSKIGTKSFNTCTNTADSISKKPTCNCPVQHVPTSYMGSNQINSTQTASNTVFLTPLNSKLISSASVAQPVPTAQCNERRAKSPSNIKQQANEGTGNNISLCSNSKRSSYFLSNSSPFCYHEPKITTISKQVGDDSNDKIAYNINLNHHPHNSHHPLHLVKPPSSLHHDEPTPLNPTEISTKSYGNECLVIPSSQENSNIAASAAGFRNENMDIYTNLPIQQHQFHNAQYPRISCHNPTLPPKLHKSLTNLKINSVKNDSLQASSMKRPIVKKKNEVTNDFMNSDGVASIQTIYTLTKSTPLVVTTRKDNEMKMMPSVLKMPVSNCEKSGDYSAKVCNKISSTFNPLQNNHATYTLPKHIEGNVSLNRTISSVVSKVPSVINIPASKNEARTESNNYSTAINSKRTNKSSGKYSSGCLEEKSKTLPKVFKKKRDVVDSTPTSTTTVKTTTLNSTNVSPVLHCSVALHQHQTPSKAVIKDQKDAKHMSACTFSKNYNNSKQNFLAKDLSFEDDYLSECENCKIAQSSKYYLESEAAEVPQEIMTLHRKSIDDNKEEEQFYYKVSHTLPINSTKNSTKRYNCDPWFTDILASSSSEKDVNE